MVHKRIVHADVVIGKGTITLAELGENGTVNVNLTEPKSGSAAGVLTFTVSGNHNLGCRSCSCVLGYTKTVCIVAYSWQSVAHFAFGILHRVLCLMLVHGLSADPKTATIKGTTGDAPPATAGFAGRRFPFATYRRMAGRSEEWHRHCVSLRQTLGLSTLSAVHADQVLELRLTMSLG